MARDLTADSPIKLILSFSFPLLIGNLFQQIYNMADTLIVGRTIGVEALASVGATGGIMFLLIGFVQAMTSGFSIVTAQYFGAQNKSGVRKSFCVSIILSAAAAFILTTLSVLFGKDLLEVMQTPANIFAGAHSYINIIYWGVTASILFNLLANTILALGDSRTPLLFLIIACILNIILDFVFILGFSWGVAGAALATVTAQIISCILCIIYIVKKEPILRLEKKDWEVTGKDLLRSVRIGVPMGFQISIIATGAIILQVALNSLGHIAVASYTVAQKIDLIAILPMMSFGLAMATYVGQNYGARNIPRIRSGVKQCCAVSLSFSVLIAMINIFAGHLLIRIFVGPDQTEVIDKAQTYLNINGSMYWVLALLFIFRYSLQGLGRSFVPTVAGIMELIMRAIGAVILTKYMGFTGACISNPLAWIGACVPLGIAYFLVIKKLSADKTLQSEAPLHT